MCGRYALGATVEEVAARFGVSVEQVALDLAPAERLAPDLAPAAAPRFNVAPGQANPVVTQDGGRHLALMQWGLVPSWAKDPRSNYSMINARVEGVESKPAYRKPLRTQRCLVPATGFYEWQAQPGGPARAAKQPFFMQVQSGEQPGGLFAFAGLYDIWQGPDGQVLPTYTILTTAANPQLAPIHERMPVILPREEEALWLDPRITDPADVLRLLQTYPAAQVVAFPVSTAVNSVAHDGPELIVPVRVS